MSAPSDPTSGLREEHGDEAISRFTAARSNPCVPARPVALTPPLSIAYHPANAARRQGPGGPAATHAGVLGPGRAASTHARQPGAMAAVQSRTVTEGALI